MLINDTYTGFCRVFDSLNTDPSLPYNRQYNTKFCGLGCFSNENKIYYRFATQSAYEGLHGT